MGKVMQRVAKVNSDGRMQYCELRGGFEKRVNILLL